MTRKAILRAAAPAAAFLALTISSCGRDLDTLDPAAFPTDGVVFLDEFGAGISYGAFLGSKLDALDVDATETFSGSASLRITVPGPDDPTGGFAGGAFVTNVPRDLTGYDALTFWAKASTTATLALAGLGNDNTGTSQYTASWSDIRLSTTWTKYIIPIPLAEKLGTERGLFFFSDGHDGTVGYEIWFDEVRFETVGTIINPRPAIATQTVNEEVGATVEAQGTVVVFDVAAADQTISAAPGYFTFSSSDETVAAIAPDGTINVVGTGSATITAKLGSVDATGAITLNADAPPPVAAPTPTRPPADVISLFSNAYPDVPVDTWSADWDVADVADVQIAGDDVKKYSNLAFAGIEFTSQPIDASAMTHFHLDVWTQDDSAFNIKLVDFGPDGAFDGGDDSEHEVSLSPSSTPAIATGAWNSLDIPLSDFTGLTGTGSVAQMIISGPSPTVYIDNVYFFGGATASEPTAAAPTPTVPAGDAISLFSNAYNDVTVDTWSAVWDDADVADVQVAGDDVKLYTNLSFAGIEFTAAPVDASAMTHFHMDIWTPDPTAAPAALRIKLVDFGADGAFDGGDDVEHELTLDETTTPALATGSWVGLDIPLADFTGLTTTAALAQMIISGDPNTLYVDNVYFYTSAPTAPTAAAPTPTVPSGDVVSLFSNAYSDVPVDTWSAVWDDADVADAQVAGDDVKLYTNLSFAGIEATSQPADASAMTHFHMDIWTPDPTTAPAAFRVKLVDFGADGAFDGGDDVEHELTFDENSTPALATGTWVSLDIPLGDFTGLTTTGAVAQMIISGDPNTVYVDNVYFYR